MKRILSNILLVLLFVSCSKISLISSGSIDQDKGSEIVINEDIETQTYGPQAESTDSIVKSERQPVICHLFPPGLYHSASYIGILKRFEKRKIPVNMLMGSEFGALISALYAKYEKASVVEWKFFSLVQKLSQKKLFSSDWKNILENFIEHEFSKIRIERLKIPLILPLYSKELNKVIYIRKGHAVTILKAHFELDRASKLSILPPQNLVLYSEEAVSNLGADIIATYIPFEEKIEFIIDDGLIWGIYSNIKNRISLELGLFKTTFYLQYKNDKIDDSSNLSSFITLSQRQAENFAIEIIQQIQFWKENNN